MNILKTRQTSHLRLVIIQFHDQYAASFETESVDLPDNERGACYVSENEAGIET
jgi:hypothetical protein